MDFEEVLSQIREQLAQEKRIAYRMLKRRFHLNEEDVEDIKADLIDAKRLAVDEDGKVLVWRGHSGTPQTPDPGPGTLDFLGLQTSDPGRWTPLHLAERIRAEQIAREARGATDEERKIITALFADLAGFTALAKDLDPEETRAIIDPALTVMMDAVHRYEGYVAQSLGDGIFALFGAPVAHEDHPQRALYAALLMQEQMRRYAERIRAEKGVPLQMRVGINTGEVVLRSVRKDDLHTDYVPVGHATNLASRMESLALPGSIVVSEHTYKLIEGYFDCKTLGATRIKGLDTPVHIYEVLGVGPLRTRLQVAAKRGLVRFVGRQRELDQLKHALDDAIAGHGQIVGVMGEPGVGKSRLLHEFLAAYCRSPILVLQTFSVSHGKAYSYLPLIDLLHHYFDIASQDDEKKRREKVIGKVLALDRSLEDTLPYLLALLGSADATVSLQQMDPQIRKRRTFDAIKRLLRRESVNQPVAVVFEDLHWLDSETQAFLLLLSESIPTARVLLLVNYRPEYHHDWGSKTYYTHLRLDPLAVPDAQDLLTALLGEAPTLQPLKQFILEKTAGTPFFIEEIVQALREQGRLPVGAHGVRSIPTDLRLPTTVQGVLAARIDHLAPDEKALLQTLSVVGKEFRLSVVQRVTETPEETLLRGLNRLQEGEFLYQRPAFPEPEYLFKHALTQEVAYNSMLTERRKGLHERTGQTLEALHHDRLDQYYGELAHHYGRSGNIQKAVEYLRLAGQQAVQRSANVEAISQLTTALAFLKTLPDTLERARQELTLQLALGTPLILTRGYAAPEVETAYVRARELCQQLGDTAQLLPVLAGLWRRAYASKGKLQTARELGEELVRLAQRVPDSPFAIVAPLMLGSTLSMLGESAAARLLLEQGVTLYDPERHRPLTLSFGVEPGMAALSNLADLLWWLGYFDHAQQRSDAALKAAREMPHPFSLAVALDFAARRHQFRREARATQERAEAAIAVCTEQGFVYRLALATMLRGWALVEQGQGEEGLTQLCQGMAVCRERGEETWRSYYLALLAEAYGKVGQVEDGLGVLVEALSVVEENGERWWEAELYRLKGELTLQQFNGQGLTFKVDHPQSAIYIPQSEEAEGYFWKAIEIARRQQARSLELRVVMSVSRLWQRQGKRTEARRLLAQIYGWFTEGFDTKDLQEAKALLDEL